VTGLPTLSAAYDGDSRALRLARVPGGVKVAGIWQRGYASNGDFGAP
jgi:hypothetical protein